MKQYLLLFALMFTAFTSRAQQEEEFDMQAFADSLNSTFKYSTGKVLLGANGEATFTIPKGFKFLNDSSSWYVLEKLWGNQEDHMVLGMLFPESMGPSSDNAWAFVVTYDAMGYVKDDDAEDMDYDELLTELKKDVDTESQEREAANFESVELIGWASTPFYDKERKALHWAKELKFGSDSSHTLNYDIRLLGRKGVLSFNAVGKVSQINEIKPHINNIIAGAEFNEGFKYSDFDPDIDTVAAITIGGLVAGKLLAKAGFFVLLLKFWKVIALGVAGFGAAFVRFFKRRKANNAGNDSEVTIHNNNL